MYAQGIVHTTGMVPSLKVALGWNPWPALKHYMLGKTSRPHFVSLYLPRPVRVYYVHGDKAKNTVESG
jgi:hypothetical protein